MLKPERTKAFKRDVKRLKARHVDVSRLRPVIHLILEDSPSSRERLSQRHRAHLLRTHSGVVHECHVDNEGDWLLLWVRNDVMAVLLRTGSHQELLGKAGHLVRVVKHGHGLLHQ